jgi:hypothetical protein
MSSSTIGKLGLAVLVFAVWPLTALAQDAADAVKQGKARVREEAMRDCSRGIIEPSVKAHMERANAAGNSFNMAGAQADLESRPEWSTQFLPKIERACSCAFKPLFKSVDAAKSVSEIDKAVADFTATLADKSKFGRMIATCSAEEAKRPDPAKTK